MVNCNFVVNLLSDLELIHFFISAAVSTSFRTHYSQADMVGSRLYQLLHGDFVATLNFIANFQFYSVTALLMKECLPALEHTNHWQTRFVACYTSYYTVILLQSSVLLKICDFFVN